MPEGVEWQSPTIISIDCLLAYGNKYYLQVYFDDCAYKIVDKQMIHHLCNYLFESDEN